MTLSPAIQLNNLRQIVALHDRYWKEKAQGKPRWDVVRTWLDTEWKPWTDEYVTSFGSPAVPSATQAADLYRSLYTMLARAASMGVPLPRPADRSADRLNQITNERFWQETGYKRGQRLSRTDPEDVRMMPVWIRIRQQVAFEAAQQAGREAANVLTAGCSAPSVGQDASTTLTPAIRLDSLRKLIALHDTFWRGRAPQDAQVAAWIVHEWRPWLADWSKINWSRVPVAQLTRLITEKESSLVDLHSRAESQGVQLPNFESLEQVAPQLQQGDLIDPDLTTAYLDKIFAADKLNKLTNERFWQTTGYKRGHKLSYRDPEDVKMMPVWTRIRRQVEQEQAALEPIEMVSGDPITYEGLTFHPLTSTVINAHPDLDPWKRDELVLQRGGGWIDMEGRQHPAKLIRSVCQPGDQLYFWNGPWGTLAGSKGIAIVRNGRVVETFTTIVS